MRTKELTEEQRIAAKKAIDGSRMFFRPTETIKEKIKSYSKQTGDTRNTILNKALSEFFKNKTLAK